VVVIIREKIEMSMKKESILSKTYETVPPLRDIGNDHEVAFIRAYPPI
jgi:hypothetical protein